MGSPLMGVGGLCGNSTRILSAESALVAVVFDMVGVDVGGANNECNV